MKVEKGCKHGHHNAPKTIIDSNEMAKGKGKRNKREDKHQRRRFQSQALVWRGQCLRTFVKGLVVLRGEETLFCKLHRVDDEGGDREGEQNAQVHSVRVKNDIDDLTRRPQPKQQEEVFYFIFGITTAFRNHIGKNRERNSTDDTQKHHVWI